MAGCVDNSSRIWDIKENKCILTLTEHTNFVQGVSWDPMNQFVASQSSDRSMNVYKLHKTGTQITGLTCCARQSKITTVKETKESETKNEGQEDFMEVDRKVEVQVLNKEKDPCWNPSDDVLETPLSNAKKTKLESSTTSMKLFHDDTLSSFFRRLSFSPDGSLLIAPAGIHRASPKENTKHVVYVFTRENLRGEPIARLGGFKKAPIAIKFSPVLYKHRRTNSNIEGRLLLPYRMIFAVACQDAVVVYDTSCLERPLAVVANLHFGTLTDLAWAPNGKILMMSSTDGYCSMVTFSENELGVSTEGSVVAQEEVVAMNYSDTAANPGEKKLEPLASTAVVNILHAGLIKKKKPTVPSMCPPVTMIQVEQSTGMEGCNENVMV
ncbi:hypothetical protein HDU79_011248 [Rhizoclosmatium sp. JEL0117]|nr:hypothetical protein HDU79_011248 [Rhizoclosmatium sp. JEL0117]